MRENNQLARTAARTGAPSPEPVRAGEHSAVQNRRIQRTAACKAPEAKAPVSPIFTPHKSG